MGACQLLKGERDDRREIPVVAAGAIVNENHSRPMSLSRGILPLVVKGHYERLAPARVRALKIVLL